MNAKVVLIADVIDSREITDFAAKRDRALQLIKQSQAGIDYRHAITAWDEIQFLLAQPTDLPAFYWQLVTHFQPLQLRIGIGIGPVSIVETVVNTSVETVDDNLVTDGARGINEVGYGLAFEAARDALGTLVKRGKQASESTVHAMARGLKTNSGLSETAISAIGNAILAPVSVMIQDMSEKQWAVLRAWNEADQSQTETAKALGINVSSVSRSLDRANIWLIQETLANFKTILNDIFAPNDTN